MISTFSIWEKEGPRRRIGSTTDRSHSEARVQEAARERLRSPWSIWTPSPWRKGASPSYSPGNLVKLTGLLILRNWVL